MLSPPLPSPPSSLRVDDRSGHHLFFTGRGRGKKKVPVSTIFCVSGKLVTAKGTLVSCLVSSGALTKKTGNRYFFVLQE